MKIKINVQHSLKGQWQIIICLISFVVYRYIGLFMLVYTRQFYTIMHEDDNLSMWLLAFDALLWIGWKKTIRLVNFFTRKKN